MYSLYLRHILIQNKLNDGRTSQKCKLGKRLKSSFLYLVQPGREEIEKIISLFSSAWKAVARGREWWAASSKCVWCVFSWNPDQSCCWAAGPSRGQSEVDNVTEQSVESGLARQHTTSLTTLPPEGGQGSPATSHQDVIWSDSDVMTTTWILVCEQQVSSVVSKFKV